MTDKEVNKQIKALKSIAGIAESLEESPNYYRSERILRKWVEVDSEEELKKLVKDLHEENNNH